ncbi:MAG: zf-HC2 domain-containing protein [Candidatus Aminicenantales bacterium]
MRCPPDKLLQAYIDGELPMSDSAGVDRHLKDCPACRERLTHLRSASELVKEKLSYLNPTRIPAAPSLRTEMPQGPARTSPFWPRLLASSIRVPAAALAMAGLFVIGVALGTILKGTPRAREERWPGHRAESGQISLMSTDSVQIFPVGLDLQGYRPLERPSIFTIKE